MGGHELEGRAEERRVEQFPVLEGLRRYALGEEREHVLLAGRPGSGKSMALRQWVVTLAGEGLVPVLVQLKGDRTVPELIKAEFRRAKVAVTEAQIDDWLMDDRLILLLDGVNEIPTEALRRDLAQFREENLSVPMVLTTRDLAIGGDFGIEKRFEMRPLSPEQLREFVGKYLPGSGEKLLLQLRDRLREIAETPLLLKMLCDLFKLTGEVPQNKGELFREFDREYDKFKGMTAVSGEFRRFRPEVLQHLAYTMMRGDGGVDFELTIDRGVAEGAIEDLLKGRVDAQGAKAKEWLEDLVEHHLLQVAADGRRLEFHHQLFQEYYAAEWLLGRVRGMDDETWNVSFEFVEVDGDGG
ncbi:MAG: signal transduction protein with Nacht domain protein, partial [Alkalinema sp. RU_4_3]|nr:signal transduction protein with Nacht domain protein [Alkalinema sp. RU_4_3]